VDGALSAWLGEPVTLVAADDVPPSVGEYFADATDDSSAVLEFTMPQGRFVDTLPILLVTTSSLEAGRRSYAAAWHTRRFRPNIVLATPDEGWLEDSWLGKEVHIGAVTVVPRGRCERCTMVTRPQPGLERDVGIYKALLHDHGGTFGVWSSVIRTGQLHVGDAADVH
jgi:uncharacterized protein YcbX